MKRILYFDCFAGISGDMTIAALIDLGLSEKVVLEEIAKLGIGGYEIDIKKTNRFSISGTDVHVKLDGGVHCQHTHAQDENQEHHHEGDHSHSHNDGERSLGHITHIINNSRITENAKKISIEIFKEIAKAEAIVHGKSLEDVHFHEVGAVDSIVDIVGAAICIDLLHIDEVVCSKVHEGQGFVNCQHGRLPIPVPAVAQMIKNSGIAMVIEDVQAELVTPTGLGILKVLKKSCGKMPNMEVEAVGYGFGKTETGRLNALRVFLGMQEEKAAVSGEFDQDTIVVLETNVDDCTGEILGYTLEKLMMEGALDAYFTPIQMKKNRPATMITVLCREEKAQGLSKVLFEETGTLGIRSSYSNRFTLPRDVRVINTEFGPIRAKACQINGKEKLKPEFEDCAKIAKEENLPLKYVQEKISKKLVR